MNAHLPPDWNDLALEPVDAETLKGFEEFCKACQPEQRQGVKTAPKKTLTEDQQRQEDQKRTIADRRDFFNMIRGQGQDENLGELIRRLIPPETRQSIDRTAFAVFMMTTEARSEDEFAEGSAWIRRMVEQVLSESIKTNRRF